MKTDKVTLQIPVSSVLSEVTDMAYGQSGTNGVFRKQGNNNYGGGSHFNQGGSHKGSGHSGNGNFHSKSGYKKNNFRNDGNKYVGAPYNFVPFTEKVQPLEESDLVLHNAVRDDLYSGEISYAFMAHTPIIVDNGRGKFAQDAYNRAAIPGSTIRGMIRANAQVLGFSSMSDDIDDYALMFRHVGVNNELKSIDHSYKDILGAKSVQIPGGGGKNISVLLNVQAGYIQKRGRDYVIIPCVSNVIDDQHGKMNYYYLSERTVIESYLNDGGKYAYEGLLSDTNNHLAHNPYKPNTPNEYGKYTPFINIGSETQAAWVDPYDDFGKKNTNKRGQLTDFIRKQYHPCSFPVSYEVTGKRVTAVGKPDQYGLNGYALLSGAMQKKKAIYIIPEMDQSPDVEVLPIPADDIRAYQIDLENKKNIVRANMSFFSLPKENEIRPVFYINKQEDQDLDYNPEDQRLYFGYTPNIRLFYKHTIKDGLPSPQKNASLDMAKAMFGFIKGKGSIDSYKSRISFSEAIAEGRSDADRVQVILGEPKPTSFNDYLETKNGHAVTYNTDGFKLRGAKQYWLRDQPKIPDLSNNKNDNTKPSFVPLKSGTCFKGKIRFDNLSKEELGLLLWCVRLEEGSRMNIGKGKPYGYGVISVTSISLSILNRAESYSTEQFMPANIFEDKSADIDNLITGYKTYMQKRLGTDDIMKDKSIRTFFLMKNFDKRPAPEKIRYMDINNREYQSRKPLQTVDDLLSVAAQKGVSEASKMS